MMWILRLTNEVLFVELTFHPLTPERWDDFEALFGPRGACAGCWCMFFLQTRKEFDANKGEANREAMQARVAGGEVPGLLAYADGVPAGWCALSPKERFTTLQRSRWMKPADDQLAVAQPVWAVPCFFVAKAFRRKGVTVGLLNAAAQYVKEQGGSILEGYPADQEQHVADAWAFTGLAGAFRKAGFEAVFTHGKRSIMRRSL